MTRPITIECQIHFERRSRGGQKKVRDGDPPAVTPRLPSRVPRVARLMALAVRFASTELCGAWTRGVRPRRLETASQSNDADRQCQRFPEA
jgi:hypothetical protein